VEICSITAAWQSSMDDIELILFILTTVVGRCECGPAP